MRTNVKELIGTRRTDRANMTGSAPVNELNDLRQPIAGDVPIAEILNPMAREGELYAKLPNDVVHCFAYAYDCRIKPGGRGICQVCYNLGGKLSACWPVGMTSNWLAR
jgi:hypothetical protein